MARPTNPANENMSERYIGAGVITSRVFNPVVARLARWGVSLMGTRLLEVRGRKSGKVRTTVVNVLTHDGDRYLVAPRGHTQWVRNLRVARTADLRLGGRSETVNATELSNEEKIPVIRAYLREWAWEVGMFFEDLKADSPDEEIAAVAPGFPVFRLSKT